MGQHGGSRGYQKEAKIVTVCAKGVRVGADLPRIAHNIELTLRLRFWSMVGALTTAELEKIHNSRLACKERTIVEARVTKEPGRKASEDVKLNGGMWPMIPPRSTVLLDGQW